MNKNLLNACYTACIVCASEGTCLGSTQSSPTNSPPSGPYTNDVPIHFYTLSAEVRPTKGSTIWKDEFDKRSTVAVYDSFGPHSTLNWIITADHGNNLNVAYINAGKNTMQ